jgi:hypothetical protein
VIGETDHVRVGIGDHYCSSDEFEASGIVNVISHIGNPRRVDAALIEQFLEARALIRDAMLDFKAELLATGLHNRVDLG